MTSYRFSIVTMALSHVVSEIFNVKKCCKLEIPVKRQSVSLKVVLFDRLVMISYYCSIVTFSLRRTVFQMLLFSEHLPICASSCMTISGERTEQLDIFAGFLPHHWLCEWFLSSKTFLKRPASRRIFRVLGYFLFLCSDASTFPALAIPKSCFLEGYRRIGMTKSKLQKIKSLKRKPKVLDLQRWRVQSRRGRVDVKDVCSNDVALLGQMLLTFILFCHDCLQFRGIT